MSETVFDIVAEMLSYKADAFDKPNVDLADVPGMDLDDAFVGWRTRLKAAAPVRIMVTVSGGLVQDISSPDNAAGVQVTVYDFDIERGDARWEVKGEGGDWEACSIVVHDGHEMPQAIWPDVRDLVEDET